MSACILPKKLMQGCGWPNFSRYVLLFGLMLFLPALASAQSSLKVGSFTKSTDTGVPVSQVIPHGLGETPKAIIIWTNGKTGEGFNGSYLFGWGITDGTTYKSMATASGDGALSRSRRYADKALTIVQGGEVVLAEADLSSWDATNFTLSWTTNNATAYVVHFIAIGGSGVSAKVKEWTMPTTTGNQAVTGVGFMPDVVIYSHLGPGFTTAAPSNTTGAGLGLGVMDVNNNEWALASRTAPTGNPSRAARVQQTDACLTWTHVDATSVPAEASFVSMDADGFTTNFSTVSGNAAYVVSLAFKGIEWDVGSFSKSTNTSTPVSQAVTGLGINPEAVLLASFQDVTQASPVDHDRFGIGASDGTTEGSSTRQDTDNVNPSSVDGIDKTSKVFVKVDNDSQAIDAEADMSSLDSDGFTLNWTTNDAVATEILYLALGATAVADSIVLHPTSDGVPIQYGTYPFDSEFFDMVNDQTGNAGTGPPEPYDGANYVWGSIGQRVMLQLDDGTVPAGATITEISIHAQTNRAGGQANLSLSYQRKAGATTPDASPIDGAGTALGNGCCTEIIETWSSLSWTTDDLDNLEIGAVHNSGDGDSRISQIYVDVSYIMGAVNDPPTVVAAMPDTSVVEDSSPVNNYRDLNDVFDDIEDGSALTFTIQSNNNPGLVTAAIDPADSTLDFSFGSNLSGSATIVVRATDSGPLFVDDTIIITVTPDNDPPTVVAAMPDTSVVEDSAPVNNYRDLNDVFDDVEDGSALTFTVQSNSNPGLVTAAIDPADSTLDFSFGSNLSGSATIVVRATDSGPLFVDDTIIITVTPDNDPPTVVAAMPDTSVVEDSSPVNNYRDLNDVFDDIEDGSALTFTIQSNNNPGLVTAAIDPADSTLDFSFAPTLSGSATIVIRATDSGPLFVDDTIVITVTPDNDPPTVVAAMPDTSVVEDSSPVNNYRDLNDVFDDIEDGSALTFTIQSNNNPGLVTAAIDPADSTLDFSFGSNLSGSATIVVRATDSGPLFVDDTIVITVTPDNDPPTVVAAMPDTSVVEDSSPVNNYRDLNDVFDDIEDGSALTFTIQSNNNPGLVTAAIDPADSTLDFSFGSNLSGSATIVVRATDSGPLFVDDTIVITVTPDNDIAGKVFDDRVINGIDGEPFNGGEGDIGIAGARVELFDGSNVFLASTTTNGSGDYSFIGLTGATTYTVRVVASTLDAGVGTLPEQTFESDGTTDYGAFGAAMGGENPVVADTTTLSTLTGAEHTATVSVGAVDVTGIDFGFSYELVVNTNDTGQGSLRSFIDNANGLSGVQTSRFNIPATDPNFTASPLAYVIQPLSALPEITDATIIDGTNQPDFATTPVIVLDGNQAGLGASGLWISVGGSTVRGLVIHQFTASGIHITTNGGNTIEGNYIGTDVTGQLDRGNGTHGIHIEADTGGNTIGGVTASERNLISGNGTHGIFLQASSTNSVWGNYIGTDKNGAPSLGNAGHGVLIGGGDDNVIGGAAPGEGNLIAGNLGSGVAVTG